MTQSPLLEARGLGKRFPGVVALDGVDLALYPGEVHALLGENGAGKSTLIKVVTGAHRRDEGTVEFLGRPIDPKTPAQAQKLGIGTVYQEVNLLPNLSVAHNVFLGREPKRHGLVDTREMRRRTATLLQRFDLEIDPGRTLDSYPVAVRQLVAIARAVDMSARVLVLDEPTASLDSREVDRLFTIIRQLKAEGVAILFITHFIDQVYTISDRITVLRNGRRVGTFLASELPRAQLVEHMLGRELQALEAAEPTRRDAADAAPVLQLDGVGTRGSVRDLAFTVAAGEAVGLSGLLGSGRTETCRAIFGLDPPDDGEMRFRGRRVRPRDPRAAISLGIGLAPEERREQGIIGPLSVRENIILALQARRGWWRRIGAKRETALAARAVEDLRIKTAGLETPIQNLSGGNQQKVILARWLAIEPDLLILDEPTRGIDIGAHAEVLKLIRMLCDGGMSLLVASSELEELVAFSHKVVVLRDRAQVAVLEGSEVREQAIMQAIAGGGA